MDELALRKKAADPVYDVAMSRRFLAPAHPVGQIESAAKDAIKHCGLAESRAVTQDPLQFFLRATPVFPTFVGQYDASTFIQILFVERADRGQVAHQFAEEPSFGGNEKLLVTAEHETQQRRARAAGTDDEERRGSSAHGMRLPSKR